MTTKYRGAVNKLATLFQVLLPWRWRTTELAIIANYDVGCQTKNRSKSDLLEFTSCSLNERFDETKDPIYTMNIISNFKSSVPCQSYLCGWQVESLHTYYKGTVHKVWNMQHNNM